MREELPSVPRGRIEFPLDILEHLPEQEEAPSPVDPNENDDNFLALFHRKDVASLNDWATVTQFKRRSIEYVVQESDVTEDFKDFLIIMYGLNWEKKVLTYQAMIVEQSFDYWQW